MPCLRLLFFTAFLPTLVLTACTRPTKSELVWSRDFPRIGSQSSPRTADLNGDGIRDIVMGAGVNEGHASDHGIIALDGHTGDMLWHQASDDQVYGTPTLYDVTGDGVVDVFIGGRSPNFKALNGKNGEVLWEYRFRNNGDPVLRHARFNFNNAVLVPDQNRNGFDELLTVNGGNSLAAPFSTSDRYPGVLMLFDSKTGQVLAADTMPDGRESYMSPLCFQQRNADSPTILFGTGGETLPGNLYTISLSEFAESRSLARAEVLAHEDGHGFIAPPTLADMNGDGYTDVIAISHASTVFAINGKTAEMLWRQTIPGTESSNSLAVGYFTDDDIPDLFTFVSKGQWPNNAGTKQIMLDGRDGRLAFVDSMGCTGFSSPVVYDLNNDGRDEAIISINLYDCALGFAGKSPVEIESRLVAIDFANNQRQVIDRQTRVKNVFTTPWIGDLDGDGYLDVVHCQYFHRGYLLNFLGMRIRRIATPVRVRQPVRWGAYMGTQGDGYWQEMD